MSEKVYEISCFSRSLKRGGACLSVALAIGHGSSAFALSSVEGHYSGHWSHAQGWSNNCISGGGSTLSWGQSGSCPNAGDSSLQITADNFDVDLVPGAITEVKVGELVWANLENNRAKDFYAIGNLKFSFTEPEFGPVSDAFSIDITNTVNDGADLIIGLSFNDFNLDLPEMISADLTLTSIEMALEENDPGSFQTFDYSLWWGKEDYEGFKWKNPEGATSRLGIYAQLLHAPASQTDIPLPASAWLILAGVAGLFSARRLQVR